MPLDLDSTFIGTEDDVGEIHYENFIEHMDEYRHNRSLNVGKQFCCRLYYVLKSLKLLEYIQKSRATLKKT